MQEDHKVHKEPKVLWDLQVLQVHRDLRVLKVKLDLQDLKVLKVPLNQSVHKVLRELKGQRVPRVLKGLLQGDHKELQVLTVEDRVHKGLKVLRDSKVL